MPKSFENRKGFRRTYCAGCRPRGKNCTFMAGRCDLVGKGLVRFCYECEGFPCRRLKNLDRLRRNKRYRWNEEGARRFE